MNDSVGIESSVFTIFTKIIIMRSVVLKVSLLGYFKVRKLNYRPNNYMYK